MDIRYICAALVVLPGLIGLTLIMTNMVVKGPLVMLFLMIIIACYPVSVFGLLVSAVGTAYAVLPVIARDIFGAKHFRNFDDMLLWLYLGGLFSNAFFLSTLALTTAK